MSDDLDRIMQAMKANGITVTVKSAPGAAFAPVRESGIVAQAAKRNGIWYDAADKETP
ncbi:hypothetical protein [Paramicrobacterium chengjingii]|uniref:Uncharacterized protein n=1 Tax=Paramicrobacterium chengjingii TaxID=2769067 RepID=A0ABX6YLM2_9MICO|nr:hypothetical protein [Microbacterium chengjingii]QPZ39716.1 hypothetical protein HCR76_06635 [Microbacterium chengjingii]